MKPALRSEAKRFRTGYLRRRGRKGITSRQLTVRSLAGYAADQCSLGACRKGYALVRRAVKRLEVRPFNRFLPVVREDLRKLGYDRG